MDNILLGIKPDIKEVDKAFKEIDDKAKETGRIAGKKLGEGIGSGISIAAKSGAATIATITGLIYSAKKFSDAASVQQDAVNKLNSSLRQLGEYSGKTSLELQKFASEIQSVTRFGDEAVIEQLSFAQAMGATADQSKKIVSAAADMASALGIDLNSAVRNISKTLGGLAGELGEIIPELKGLTQEQMKSGAAIDLIASKFNGFAQRDANTFSGSVDQMSNAFGDFIEEIGKTINNSEMARRAIVDLKNTFVLLGEYVKENAPQIRAFFSSTIEVFSTAVKYWSKALNENMGKSLKQINDDISSTENKIKEFEDKFINPLQKDVLQKTQSGGLNWWDKNFGTLQALKDRQKEILPLREKLFELQKLRNDMRPMAVDQAEFSLLPPMNQEQMTQLEAMKQSMYELGYISKQIRDSNVDPSYLESVLSQNDAISLSFSGLVDQMKYQASKMKITMGQMASAAVNTLGRGFGGAFAAMGQALANGENALGAFAKAMIGTLGDIAIQMGTSFILQGIANSANPLTPGAGGPLIAAGAALATFGGVLKAMSGGGGGAPATSGGGSVPGSVASNEMLAPMQTIGEEPRRPDTNVQVVINGDVLDSDETGTRIINLINSAFDKQGIIINQAYA